MRQYKGIRKDNGELAKGDLIQKNGRAWIVTEFETPKCIKCGGLQVLSTTYEVIPKTVGQSTGLKDKSRVEIYFGDIVLCKRKGAMVPYRVYLDDTTQHQYIESLDGEGDLQVFFDYHFGCKVIGNIHQNKNLLET